jgi:hypothetical protein
VRHFPPVFEILGPPTIATLGLIPAFFNLLDLPVWVKILLIALAWLASGAMNYWRVYRPLKRVTYEHEAALGKVVLEQLLQQYREYTMFGGDVRVNVMRVRRPIRSQFRQNLIMAFALGEYSAHERALAYPRGTGACGQALARNAPIWFDRTLRHDHLVPMSDTHHETTKDVVSVLSIPIYHPLDQQKLNPIGILNLDSPQSAEMTKFDDSRVWDLAIRASSYVGVLLQ